MASNRPSAKSVVQIDNEKMIVTEWTFPVGAETGWHKHLYDYVVVPMLDGVLTIETKEGTQTHSTLTSGHSYTRSCGVEHNVINANDFEFRFIELELK